ncbi:MAG: prepilin-type N-terminal cleavage/methylation domain-containing protein [Cellvibrionales bacterium]|nr:prepilin-type N-terminal cleavage/methylation domain-containing protein [Cellvibrionales bacterium]
MNRTKTPPDKGEGGASPPKKPPPVAPARARGFTLLEVVVVVTIIAMTVGLLTLGIGQTAQRGRDADAERLLSWLQAAADTAVFQTAILGVAEHQDGLILLALYQDDWYRLAESEPLPLDKLSLRWSPELREQAERLAAAERSKRSERTRLTGRTADSRYRDDQDILPPPYMLLLPSGQIQPEGDIQLLGTGEETPFAVIDWRDSQSLRLAWQEQS